MAREQRKLAAIVAIDVVGYSRLMGRDESGTLARLKKNRSERLHPILTKYAGRLVKLTGDGTLVEFGSAVDALSAAIEFQQAMAEANNDQPAETVLAFRIGLHLGDLIVDGDDLYGDGVNIAARLEAEAPAGGILMSRTVHEAVTGRVKATFDDVGVLALKNIERSVQAFRVKWEPSEWRLPTAPETAVAPASAPRALLSLPDKPSIAVLPFQNMSGDPEQEYFADGMVEEIITALSHFNSLFVIARNSSFTYKGKVVDVRTVGRELGVRYVLEGSVRKAANRLRITGQLVEGQTGAHLWADRFDGTLDEIFDLQDRIALSVVSAVTPKVDQAEIERARRKPIESLDAYDFYLRGLARFVEHTNDGDDAALRYFYDAIERDPDFAAPYGMAAHCHVFRLNAGRVSDRGKLEAETRRLSERVAVLDSDAKALSEAGHALAYCWDHEIGATLLDRALAMNPNLASGWGLQGYVSLFLGQHEAARGQFAKALRLSPRDTSLADWERGTAVSLTLMGNYQEGSEWANRALARQSGRMPNVRAATFANALAGDIGEARRLAARMLQLDPTHRISRLRDYTPYRRHEDVELMARGLRLAGIPE